MFRGWFKAPATTNYRFYITCDDHCNIRLGNETGNSTNTEIIVENYAWTYYRNWFQSGKAAGLVSEWISLTEGEYYYIEGNHYEGGGGDHFTAAVEIEQTEIVGHHESVKERQYIGVQANETLTFEQTRINITDVDSGSFILLMQDPDTLETMTS